MVWAWIAREKITSRNIHWYNLHNNNNDNNNHHNHHYHHHHHHHQGLLCSNLNSFSFNLESNISVTLFVKTGNILLSVKRKPVGIVFVIKNLQNKSFGEF